MQLKYKKRERELDTAGRHQGWEAITQGEKT